MAELPELRSPPEMRDYLVRELNSALRRPGMYGGEVTLRLVIDHLLHLERDDEAWAGEMRSLESRGAWTSTGASGAFRRLIPGPYEHEVASVYSEFARARGWLRADRTLRTDEYDQMRTRIPAWATYDHFLSEVLDAFGPPSVRLGGGSPYYGKTLGYVAEPADSPMIFFHLWNGADPDAESVRRYVSAFVRCPAREARQEAAETPSDGAVRGRKQRKGPGQPARALSAVV